MGKTEISLLLSRLSIFEFSLILPRQVKIPDTHCKKELTIAQKARNTFFSI